MTSARTQTRSVLAAAALLAAVLVFGVYFAWPVSLGGNTAYVITRGTSMQPRFHTGDLAITRSSGHYAVGDIVAYHSVALHTVVMHRIVSIQNGLYTFKGDNNSWLDPAAVSKNELIGRLSTQIPAGGIWLHRAESILPIGITLILILVPLAIMANRRNSRERSRRGGHRAAIARSRSGARNGFTAAAITSIASVIGLMLLTLTWLAPASNASTTSTTVSTTAQPAQVVFSYSAKVKPSAAYDGTTVRSPDPIFRKVTESVAVHFDYTGSAGSVSVAGILSAPSGWHTSIKLAPATSFTGDHYSGTIHLDLAVLSARAQAAAKVTAFPTSLLTMTVQPTFTAADGKPFSAPLKLSITPLQLTVANGPPSLTVTAPNAPSGATTGAPATANRRSVVILDRRIPLSTVVVLAVILLVGGPVTGVILMLRSRRERNDGEAISVKKRHPELLVAVAPMPVGSGRPVVDVAAMSTLVKLAERYGLLILHWSRSGIETFIIQDQNTTYRYRTVEVEPPSTGRHREGAEQHPLGLGATNLL
jgi:signal peptidase I